MVEEEGLEYQLEKSEEWDALVLNRGDVIEVHLPSTNLACTADVWAGFWVKQVLILGTGEYAAIVKSLGCSDPDWSKYLSGVFNRRKGAIHVCQSRPCAVTEEFALHVTKLRVFTVAGFARPYMTHYTKRQIQKWEADGPEEVDDTALDVSAYPREESAEMFGDDTTPEEPRKSALRATGKAAPKPTGGEEEVKKKEKKEKIGEEERLRLRERLEAARQKMLDSNSRNGAGPEAVLPPATREVSVASSSSGYSASLAEENQEGLEVPAIADAGEEQKKKVKEPRRAQAETERRRERKEREKSTLEVAVKKSKSRTMAEDTKDITTHSWQDQLLRKAAQTAAAKQDKIKAEKIRQRKKDPGYQLAQILTKITQGGTDRSRKRQRPSNGGSEEEEDLSRQKKKKKKKKKKGHRSGPGGSSSPGSSSQIGSSDSNSMRDLERDESSSSEGKKLEAPLKRKSKNRPGSVLAMLLEHARSKLDQSAKVSVETAATSSMTKGIKLSSYFSIIVRPQVGSSMAQARELHHLSQAIDLLRQGDLDVLGDVLASRFISIHQAVIDGSWATARHLEMLPLEEGSAAGPEVILNARRQARLAAKLAPGDAWSWSSTPRSKGGRGKGSQWQDGGQEGKGKGKKGGKGKMKGKGWQNQEKETDGKTREKIPEK